MKKIMSIDAETNGLWGNPFAVAAIIYEEETGKEISNVVFRLPNETVTNEWVKENVLPTLNFEITHESYAKMLQDFSKWYMENKEDSTVLWHMGHVVETHLFREMHQLGFIGDWDAPYTPIEVSETLRLKGFAPDSCDAIVKEFGLEIKDYGCAHNPLYDCEVAFKVWKHVNSL